MGAGRPLGSPSPVSTFFFHSEAWLPSPACTPTNQGSGGREGCVPHALRHLPPRGGPLHGHMEDLRVTPPSQPRSGDRQGHTQLEKREGPSPAAPAGRRSSRGAPTGRGSVLGLHPSTHRLAGRERHPPPRNENCHCPEACLFWKHLTKRLPRWLSGNPPALHEM